MFSVHGLSTPHFILPKTHLPGVSAQLSMVLATIWLMFSSLPTDSRWANLCQRDPDVYLYPLQTIKDDNTGTFISKF